MDQRPVQFEDLSPKAQEGIETFRRYITNLPEGYKAYPDMYYGEGMIRASGSTLTVDLDLNGLLYGQLFTLGCGADDMVKAVNFAYQHRFWVTR